MKVRPVACAFPTGTGCKADAVEAKDKVEQGGGNQQKRIGKGIESGSLTTKEGANLEKKEAGVRKEVHADRAANGGKLTADEKKQVNQQQNKISKQVYNKKHNDKTR